MIGQVEFGGINNNHKNRIDMKKLAQVFLFLIVTIVFAISCSNEDEAASQAEGRVFIPRVFNETSLFPENVDSVRVLSVNQPLVFSGLKFSPGGKVAISWKINDTEVSTDPNYTFVSEQGGDFRIKLDVSYEGTTISRYRDVFVVPPTYTPKTSNNFIVSFLTDNANDKSIEWDKITHAVYKIATVTATGTMDVSKGEAHRKAEKLVGRGHLNGVPVLLGISGALSGDGWNVNGSFNFGNAIRDNAKRAALVTAIKNYITAKKMDGVDIMMTDIGGAAASVTPSMVAVGTFINDLRTALGAQAIITTTVTSDNTHTRYPANSLSGANWINVHAFEDGLHVGPNAVLGQSSGYDYFVSCANIWKAKYPTSKLVIGIPAMGLRYNTLNASGNNLSWTSYDYIPYKTILDLVPNVFDKEYTASIAKGVYFNGVPLVTQKAAYLKANGYLGAYIWAGDYDTKEANSLTRAISTSLK